MNRQFPLAGLLQLRGRAEERAAAELASARREQARLAAVRAATLADLSRATTPARGDDLAWLAATSSRVALAALLSERDGLVHAADAVVEDCTQQWSIARRDVRALERLEERHVEAWTSQELHTEQAALDEVAGRSSGPTAPGAASGSEVRS
jgi:flagellar FliJ protein